MPAMPTQAATPPRGATNASRPTRLRLRSVDAGFARLAGLVSAGLQAEITLDGQTLLLTVGSAQGALQPPTGPALCFDTPQGRIELAPAHDMLRLLTGIELADANADANADDNADPLALYVMTQALPADWFALFGASAVVAARDSVRHLVEVPITLMQPELSWSVAASLLGSADALYAVLSGPAWRRVAAPAWPLPAGWTLRLPVCAGHARVPAASLRTLAAGDIVVITDPRLSLGGQVDLQVGAAAWACRLQWGNRASLEVTERLATRTDGAMENEPNTGVDDADSHVTVQEVPVLLSFDLGAVEMTLAQLQALGVGSVLPITGPLPPEVILRAGRFRIGAGELVEVDGRLGVEIRRLGDPP